MRVRAGVAFAVWVALAGAPNAAAATFAVTRTDDPAPGACEPADCSLREAVLAANAGSGGDMIVLPAGHLRLTIVGAGEDAGAKGDLDLTKNVRISGAGARWTIVDATGSDRVFDVASGVQSQITRVTVTGGQVAGNGGGIRNLGVLGLIQDAIVGNHAQGSGGGVENDGNATILQSLIARNQATSGGGLHTGGASDLQTTTVSGNMAGAPGVTGHGGGIDGSGGLSLVLGNSTLTDNQSFNSALTGGGIEDAPYANPYNTILADNRTYAEDQSTSALSNCADPLTSGGYNLSDGTDCGLDQPFDRQGVPVLLGPLADNGGPTDTEAVLPGSLALDTGACVGVAVVDQRGVSRPRGSACDIGAYEFAPPLAATTVATSVAFSSATLTGTVDPSYRETTAYFEYGRTTEYGSKTPVRNLGSGSGQVPFTEPLAGLRQGVTYHYRLVAANAEGTTMGADQSFTTLDRTKPVLTLLRVVPGLFHRKNGATLAFTLTENATVTFRFDHVLRGVKRRGRCVARTRRNRHRRPCTRYLPVTGSVVVTGSEGPNSLHFDARVGEKLLTFGAYRLRARARDPAGNLGKTVVAAFRVLR
jgi:CSLREA domain-containing protein